jgi:predicted lysophospholipase L1 biosynthesis ABC-type transport system permease subunit
VPNGDRRLGEGRSVFEIVGVVEDVRFLGPRLPSEPAIYLPFEHFAVGGRVLLVRPERPGIDLLPELREVIRQTVPGVAIEEAGTLAALRSRALARPRFNMMLLVFLSGVALLLCTLGAYGIVARTVATRRREIGVRAALGARGASIVRSVLGQALIPLAIGAASGLVVALGTSRLLTSLLFELSPSDPVSLMGAPLILLGVGCVGALLPSLRALAVDPAEALRAE